jgi:hypothetical protein
MSVLGARLSPSAKQSGADAAKLTPSLGKSTETELDQELAWADPSGLLARRFELRMGLQWFSTRLSSTAAAEWRAWDKRCVLMIGILSLQYRNVLQLLFSMCMCHVACWMDICTERSTIYAETILVVAAILAQRSGLLGVLVVRPVHSSRFEQVCMAPGFLLIVRIQMLVVRTILAHPGNNIHLLEVMHVCVLWLWIGQTYLHILNDNVAVPRRAPSDLSRSTYIEQATYAWVVILLVSQMLPAWASFVTTAIGVMLVVGPDPNPSVRSWRHQITSSACCILFSCATVTNVLIVIYHGFSVWNDSIVRVLCTTLYIIMITGALISGDPATWRQPWNRTFGSLVALLCCGCYMDSLIIHLLLRTLVLAVCARPLSKMMFEADALACAAVNHSIRSRFT